MRRYRPGAVPVETRLLPASSRFITVFDSLPGYSRWVPVVLNILKQPGTWAGSTRFNTVHPGSPRLSTVPPRLWHGSSRIIKPGWTSTLNRDSENGALSYWPNIIWSLWAQKEASQARLSLDLSKWHIVGNHISRFIMWTHGTTPGRRQSKTLSTIDERGT